MAADVAAGTAVVQRLPDGARVTLLGPTLFPNGPLAQDDKSTDTRTGVIEGLLDPRLMRVAVADTTTLPDEQRQIRVQNVETYFADFGLADTLEAPPANAAPGPAGLTISIAVYCPKYGGQAGDGSGQSKPVCE